MGISILLDTSAAIEYFENSNEKVASAIKSEDFFEVLICGMTKFGLAVGLDDEEDIKRLDNIPCLGMDCSYFSKAAEVYKKLESVGKKPSFEDCVIAMAAVMNDSLLLTFDKDFRQFEEFGLKMKLLS